MKVWASEGIRMKEPIAKDQDVFRRLGPDLVYHHIIRMHAQQHVWENGIIENPVMIPGFDVAYGQRAGIPLMVRLFPLVIGISPPRNGPSTRSFSAES